MSAARAANNAAPSIKLTIHLNGHGPEQRSNMTARRQYSGSARKVTPPKASVHIGPRRARPVGPAHHWELMKKAGARGFLIHELVSRSNGRAYGTLSSYVWWACEMGVVAEIGREPARQPGAKDAVRFAVVKPFRNAPIVRRADFIGLRGRVQEQLWTAMRVLPQFTVREIAAVSSTEEVEVQPVVASKYVKRLFRAGLLTTIVKPLKGAPGTRGATAGVYRLKPAFNRGPRPPAIIGLRVFDFNAGAFVGGRIDGSEDAGEVAA